MIASVLPLWVQIPVAAFGALGAIASTIITIINAGEAVERLRHGSRRVKASVKAQLRRSP